MLQIKMNNIARMGASLAEGCGLRKEKPQLKGKIYHLLWNYLEKVLTFVLPWMTNSGSSGSYW